MSSFSGNQSLKDKGLDLKFRLLEESNFIPQLAIGVRDIGGTSLFASEFIVASKRIKNADFTLGMGWGVLSNNSFKNPLGNLSDRFYTRQERDLDATSEGGALNLNTLFTGKSGVVWRNRIIYPKVKWIKA